MGQELLKNLNEHETGIEGFLGQNASRIVNNYFQRPVWLANLHLCVPPRVSILTRGPCNLQGEPPPGWKPGSAVGWERLPFSRAGPGALRLNEPG